MLAKFNEILRELRKEKNMTQEQLAKKLNLSRSSVEMYEKGQREPGFLTQEAIADLFNVDIDYLFGRKSVRTEHLITEDDGERILIELYRANNEAYREHILQYCKMMAEYAKANAASSAKTDGVRG